MMRSIIERRARAPVPLRMASAASARRPSLVMLSVTPSMPRSFAYCLVIAFFGSVSTETNWSSLSSSRVATTGRRPMNSGMRPKLMRSSGSTILRVSARLDSFVAAAIGALNPMVRPPSRRWMIFSRPTKAPPQMKRIFSVLIWMYSCCGCLRPPWGGTLQTAASRILRRAC